ncbi:RsfA family transcriptional regulator [Alkalihalobacillus sp. MEB203]|uniref:RsfA family transcriptional regulator n=2 Tax=Alkalihalobacterium chitinilyticum TaxID=2980103 RepID=A0ABT5VE39_9BACI|nr:RsfA family transcriptional regulator [Alkalihalobacterium chitinilyticum]
MMKVRQDAWSHEDDVLLAETVLRHIREGSTQLVAFDEVGDELHRTSAACGFRWNAVVRQKYVDQIREAKKERKERKRAAAFATNRRPVRNASLYYPVMNTAQPLNLEGLDIETVISYLRSLTSNQLPADQLKKENEKLLKENLELLTQNKELEAELKTIQDEHQTIEEDYQSLIQIMNRARRMAILQEEEPLSNATFRMDKNGNLEKVAK